MQRYVLGDIHGHSKPLEDLLNQVNFDYKNDELISMGDLCDRGPDTWGVLEILLKVENLVLIVGNHDGWLKDHLKNKKTDGRLFGSRDSEMIWLHNGGKTTLKSYEEHNYENIDKHIELLESAKPFYVKDNICFVHGGFDKNFLIAEQHKDNLCWDRELVQQAMSCHGKRMKLKTADNFDLIFIGHTPTLYWNEPKVGGGTQPILKPIYSGGIWNVDTGSGKGGVLTLMNLDTKEYIQSELTVND